MIFINALRHILSRAWSTEVSNTKTTYAFRWQSLDNGHLVYKWSFWRAKQLSVVVEMVNHKTNYASDVTAIEKLELNATFSV